MNEIQLFKDEQFGEIRTLFIDGNAWFVALDIAKALGYSETSVMTRRLDDDETQKIASAEIVGANSMSREVIVINESGLYNAVLGSNKPNARGFKKWITSVILPSIRKTGSYSITAKDSYMIEDPVERAKRWIAEQEEKAKIAQERDSAVKEVEYKEDVIIGLVKDVSLADKRQRLNQIMRHNFSNGQDMQKKWRLLYSEFESKFHIDLHRRIQNSSKPTMSKMSYIDTGLKMIPELYELACKLFENDVDQLKVEWFNTVVQE